VECRLWKKIQERISLESYVLKGWFWSEFEDEERFFRTILKKWTEEFEKISSYTDKKENRIFLIYKKFRVEQLQSHI
jgi:hypothetical protein